MVSRRWRARAVRVRTAAVGWSPASLLAMGWNSSGGLWGCLFAFGDIGGRGMRIRDC